MTAYTEVMQQLLEDDYFKKILHWPLLDEKVHLMKTAFPEYKWEGEEMLKFNRAILKSTVNPVNSLTVFLEDYNDKNLILAIENYGQLPLLIDGIIDESGRMIGFADDKIILLKKEQKSIQFKLDKNFQRLFVNKKKKKGGFSLLNDLEKVKVSYRILGNEKNKEQTILPWSNQNPYSAANDPFRSAGNLGDFSFLEVDEQNKNIICKPGMWNLESNSPVKFIGTPDRPIRFFSEYNNGRGILVMNTVDTSILKYCAFDQLFEDLGNDAIDVSGSKIQMENIVIKRASDKGLSAGEKTTMTGQNIEIYESEIAVASKDDSQLKVSKLFLEGNNLCFTAFQKKPEFGPASLEIIDVIMQNNTLDHLIENYSSLLLNGKQMPTVDRVKDQMYGVIYGKSSK